MKGLVRLGILLGVGALTAVACQKAADRPQEVTACSGDAWTQGCGNPGPTTGVPEGGDAASEAAEAASDVSVTLTGTVRGISNDNFATTVPYAGTATIYTQHESGLADHTNYDGSTYTFVDAPYTTGLWVKTEPQQGGPGAPYLPTLIPVDTTQGGAVDLVIVASGVLDQIYSLITSPTQRTPGFGQVVLAFVDSAGKPVSGLNITTSSGGTIIYSAQGSWTDIKSTTDSAALVVIANAAAGLMPVSIDNSQGASVQVESDTVTLAKIQVH